MATYSPANFDAILEHIVTVILKLTLTHPLALALSQSFVNTYDDFRTININDVHEFRYNMTSVSLSTLQGREQSRGLRYSNLMGY
jgi:hypothetical protein